KLPDQAREPPARSIPRTTTWRFAVIGVDVLAEQRDLARATGDQRLRFGDDLRHRPRELGAARVGHDTEGTELVAAFLDREERADRRSLRHAEGIEFRFRWEFG